MDDPYTSESSSSTPTTSRGRECAAVGYSYTFYDPNVGVRTITILIFLKTNREKFGGGT